MKKTEKTLSAIHTVLPTDKYPAMGTSFHDNTIKASPDEIAQILKQEPQDSGDKSQHEWEAIIEINNQRHFFHLYDWKVSREIRRTDQAIFHIGAESPQISLKVQNEMNFRLSILRLKS